MLKSELFYFIIKSAGTVRQKSKTDNEFKRQQSINSRFQNRIQNTRQTNTVHLSISFTLQCENQHKLKVKGDKIVKTVRMLADSVTVINTLGSGPRGSMPGSSKNVISFPKRVTSSGGYLASCPIDTWGPFPGRKETG
jgi:hypothetical protein